MIFRKQVNKETSIQYAKSQSSINVEKIKFIISKNITTFNVETDR